MTIVVTGGGSGGHTTPLLAVASEIKRREPKSRVVYIAQRGDRLADTVAVHPAIDKTYYIFAGKFRRYHGEGWRQLLDLRTLLLNARDALYVVIGLLQSLLLMVRERPQVTFVKGGFVGVPVGLAAAVWRRPYVTHDSDALAGLANRIIARWAVVHAVALPAETYAYPAEKTVTTGVPIAAEYQFVTPAAQAVLKRKLAVPVHAKLVFVTGGGLGAQRINRAVVALAPQLLKDFEDVYLVHATGHKHHIEISEAYTATISDKKVLSRIQTIDFTNELYTYSGAADVIIARAGATNIAEFAMQGKACVIVPNPVLAGGHQLKNAAAYEAAGAARIVTETALAKGPDELKRALVELLHDDAKRMRLGKKLHSFAHKDSAKELVNVLLTHANRE